MKAKIKKGDTVEVISGRYEDKGRRGEVIKVMPNKGRITVQGVSMRKKHQSQVQTQGRSFTPGIIEFEGPVDISNVMLVCPKCDEATRVAVQRDEDGTSKRVCKKCGTLFD
ncbi:50S ribosomal protein L24 [Chloroflexota bacterium]